MKTPLLLLAMAAALAAHAAPVLPYAKAAEDAKASGADVIVLCTGTGWLAGAAECERAFRAAAAASTTPGLLWAVYDERRGLDNEARKALGKLPYDVFGYPAWIYADAAGHPLWHQESVTAAGLARLPREAAGLAAKRVRRDAALKRADALDGRAKAAAIGAALAETLDPVIDRFSARAVNGYRGRYQDLLNRINQADPGDADGYAFKYAFWFQPVLEGTINKNDAAKDYAANYAFIAAKLALPCLTPGQRQQLKVFEYKTALSAGDFDRAIRALDEAAALAPGLPQAAACRNLKRYLTEPVHTDGLRWRRTDNRPRWTPMIVDVTAKIRSPGAYRLEFRHVSGQTKFRDPVIRAGAAILAKADGEKKEFTLSVDRQPSGRIELVVESQGTGWFDGKGDIIIEKQ